jgi:hypothetical protein
VYSLQEDTLQRLSGGLLNMFRYIDGRNLLPKDVQSRTLLLLEFEAEVFGDEFRMREEEYLILIRGRAAIPELLVCLMSTGRFQLPSGYDPRGDHAKLLRQAPRPLLQLALPPRKTRQRVFGDVRIEVSRIGWSGQSAKLVFLIHTWYTYLLPIPLVSTKVERKFAG